MYKNPKPPLVSLTTYKHCWRSNAVLFIPYVIIVHKILGNLLYKFGIIGLYSTFSLKFKSLTFSCVTKHTLNA